MLSAINRINSNAFYFYHLLLLPLCLPPSAAQRFSLGTFPACGEESGLHEQYLRERTQERPPTSQGTRRAQATPQAVNEVPPSSAKLRKRRPLQGPGLRPPALSLRTLRPPWGQEEVIGLLCKLQISQAPAWPDISLCCPRAVWKQMAAVRGVSRSTLSSLKENLNFFHTFQSGVTSVCAGDGQRTLPRDSVQNSFKCIQDVSLARGAQSLCPPPVAGFSGLLAPTGAGRVQTPLHGA